MISLAALPTTLNASPAGPLLTNVLEELSWRFVGPWRGGRVNAVVGHPDDRATFLAGYTGGGVWKTTDGGVTWRNVSDSYFGTGSIGAMDMSRSHPEIVYVGTGEQALRGDVSHGDGIYKSIDGGETWVNVGLENTRQIARLFVHPTNPDVVFVAAIGHFAGPNPERGVFRTVDGGQTWERVLFVNEDTGAVGLALDPNDPDIIYAAMWDVRRFPWGIRSAGDGSALYRSRDGGQTWDDVSSNRGFPGGIRERMDVSLSPTKPGRVWALVSSAEDRGLFRSDDYGDSWIKANGAAELTGRTFYFMKLLADPQDADTVYVLNFDILRSTDGGESFEAIPSGHADHHAFWIDPEDNQRIIDGSDGGAQISFNGGQSWSTLFNQPTAQIYTLTLDDRVPFNLYGSQQDWSTVIVSHLRRDADPRGFFDTGYSEAGHIAISKSDPDLLFISDHHWLLKYDRRTDAIKYVGPRDETNYGWGTQDIRYRFNWTFPVVTSQHQGNTIYAGSQYLHVSDNRGETWQLASPDLTLADPETLERTPLPGRDVASNDRYWGPLTRDSNGDHWFATLYTIAESPVDGRIIWTGSDDGLVHVTRNGTKDWRNVTPPDLPEYAMVTRVAASPREASVAYFTASAYKLDDYRPFIYKTDDFGESWQRITSGIDDHEIMRVVRVDPERPGLLYAGSETGVYMSFDDGANWVRMAADLPTSPVYDMKVRDGSLVVATHGRGFWTFDHLALVRQLKSAEFDSTNHLFSPAPVMRLDGDWADENNPSFGALIRYWLGPVSSDELTITIRDSQGAVVRSFVNNEDSDGAPTNAPGLNTFEWDLRYPNATVVPDVVTRGNTQVGPVAVPGDYQVELQIGEENLSRPLSILPDPRIAATQSDLEAQFDFLIKVRDKIDDVNRAVIELRQIEAAIAELQSSAPELSKIEQKLQLVEQKLVQPKARYRKDLHAHPVQVNDKLYRLANFVSRSHARPTPVQYTMFDEFSAWADEALAEFQSIVAVDISRYNATSTAAGCTRLTWEEGVTESDSVDSGAEMPRR